MHSERIRRHKNKADGLGNAKRLQVNAYFRDDLNEVHKWFSIHLSPSSTYAACQSYGNLPRSSELWFNILGGIPVKLGDYPWMVIKIHLSKIEIHFIKIVKQQQILPIE